ncbi:uncharacterized protein LOC121748276 [Salvia splendens]|uniref:uncharacterized protein LOC121748276 n=1 Tax=Salvia splendens TaxID=180675 RepID=UPI001C270649|nr:uncharacterized protein LOC121748276 [Salvia splendens]XP_041998454.1 uncharacterized protein LOC121748276 [Salvia splendens]
MLLMTPMTLSPVPVDELLDNLDKYSWIRSYTCIQNKKLWRPSVVLWRQEQIIKELKFPELLVSNYKPHGCVVRQWIIKHALLLLPACALIVGCILIACRAYQRHLLSGRAEQLYHEVCDILEEKPSFSKSINGESEPCVVASSLRDHLLLP